MNFLLLAKYWGGKMERVIYSCSHPFASSPSLAKVVCWGSAGGGRIIWNCFFFPSFPCKSCFWWGGGGRNFGIALFQLHPWLVLWNSACVYSRRACGRSLAVPSVLPGLPEGGGGETAPQQQAVDKTSGQAGHLLLFTGQFMHQPVLVHPTKWHVYVTIREVVHYVGTVICGIYVWVSTGLTDEQVWHGMGMFLCSEWQVPWMGGSLVICHFVFPVICGLYFLPTKKIGEKQEV